MNKREFEKIIKESMNGLSLEKQEEFLKKVQSNWLPEIQEKFYKEVSKKYTKCWECGKYSLTSDFENIHEQVEHKGVIVYVDAGYGDNDEIADVTYLMRYAICPKCKHKKLLKKTFISEKNRHKCR